MVASRHLPYDTLGVNDEETTKGDTFILQQNAVFARYVHVSVSKKRKHEVRTKSTLLARLRSPSVMGKLRIRRDPLECVLLLEIIERSY